MNSKKIHASKIIAAVAAGAVAISAMAVSVSAVKTIGSASIYLADETWSSQVYWGSGIGGSDTIGIASVTPAEITGDGTYTTSVEFENAMDYGFYFSLNSDIRGTANGAFADYPDAAMSITSVKADGVEISGNTSISDVTDNGYIKINIFDPLTDAGENYANSLDWTSGIKSMEVTFTVTGTGVLSAEAPEEDVQDKPSDEGTQDKSDDGNADGTATPEDTAEGEQGGAPADDNTEAPDTGNTPISPMAAVTALAGLIAFMAKKK